MTRILSSDEAATALKVTRDTIHRYVTEGLLPADRIGMRGIIKIDAEELQRFAVEHGMACYLPEGDEEVSEEV